jgi:lipopolysaccharide export LptBFGC system permease protein LptF
MPLVEIPDLTPVASAFAATPRAFPPTASCVRRMAPAQSNGGGALTPFMLYGVTEFTGGLGAAGFGHPLAAVRLPAIVGCVTGATGRVQEDG